MKKIQDILIDFGLTSNAAKAYTALLKKNPSTGYEISTQTDIPRSAIYNVLNKLVALGFANSVGESPKKYLPLPPSALLEYLSQSHKDKLNNLEDAFKNVEIEDKFTDFWHLHGYRNIMLKMKELINNANKKIIISGWKREFSECKKELMSAKKEEELGVLFFHLQRWMKNLGK